MLRLICIQSIVNCGLKPKVLEQYKRDIIHSYGFQHILTLTNLEKVGLLKIQVSLFNLNLKIMFASHNIYQIILARMCIYSVT